MTTTSRHDSTELAHVWQLPPSSFDAEDAPWLVASVFGQVQVERWDAPLVRLPNHHNTTTRVATEAGTPWSRYAAGDHSRWPQPE